MIQKVANTAMAATLLLCLFACAEKEYLDVLEGTHWLGGSEDKSESWCMSFDKDQLLQFITYKSSTNEVSYNYGIYNLMRGKKVRTLTRIVDREEFGAVVDGWQLENWDKSKLAQELSWVVTELSEERFAWVSKGLLRQGDGRVTGEREARVEYLRTESCQKFIAAIPEDASAILPVQINY